MHSTSVTKVLLLVLMGTTLVVLGMQNQQREKRRYFIEPRESVLPVIVSQPNCPLKFERILLLRGLEEGFTHDYLVRNQSDKPVVALKIVRIGLGGGHAGVNYRAQDSTQWIMPGQVWPQAKENIFTEIVPLTENLRKHLRAGPPMKSIQIFMVVRVEYADGSIYSDEAVYNELQALSEDIELPRR